MTRPRNPRRVVASLTVHERDVGREKKYPIVRRCEKFRARLDPVYCRNTAFLTGWWQGFFRDGESKTMSALYRKCRMANPHFDEIRNRPWCYFRFMGRQMAAQRSDELRLRREYYRTGVKP